MKNKFYFLVPIIALASCSQPNNVSNDQATHPALTNPAVLPYTEAIAADSENASLYFKRAEMLNKMELVDLTRADLQRAVSLDTGNVDYRQSLAMFLIDKGPAKEALQAVKWLQKSDPRETSYLLLEAEAHLASGSLESAQTLINELLIKLPQDPAILLDASKIAAARKDTKEAIAYAQKAIGIAPKYYDGLYHLADLYREQKDAKALDLYKTVFQLDTLNAYPVYDMAQYYLLKGDHKEAKAYLKNTIQIDKNFVKAYLDYGTLLLAEDSVDKADRQFQIATEVSPANAGAYYGKGLIHLKRQNKPLAAQFFEQALIFDAGHAGAKEALKKFK